MKKEKSFSKGSKIIIILFWILVIVLGVFIFLSPKWKTYSHSHFGFQFKYPAPYHIEESPFFNGLSLKVVDPIADITYFEVNVYGLPETAVEMEIPEDPIFSGPYPKKIPANEKNGEIVAIEKTFNNIHGIEAFGAFDEGTNFFDSFNFRKGEYEWRIELSPVGEGRIEDMPWSYPGHPFIFNKDNYLKIRNSFSLIESK